MKPVLICLSVILILISSTFAWAQAEETQKEVPGDSCLGFWGKISCFLFGNPENRAGQSWFDRSGALVGMAAPTTWSCDSASKCTCQVTEGCEVIIAPKDVDVSQGVPIERFNDVKFLTAKSGQSFDSVLAPVSFNKDTEKVYLIPSAAQAAAEQKAAAISPQNLPDFVNWAPGVSVPKSSGTAAAGGSGTSAPSGGVKTGAAAGKAQPVSSYVYSGKVFKSDGTPIVCTSDNKKCYYTNQDGSLGEEATGGVLEGDLAANDAQHKKGSSFTAKGKTETKAEEQPLLNVEQLQQALGGAEPTTAKKRTDTKKDILNKLHCFEKTTCRKEDQLNYQEAREELQKLAEQAKQDAVNKNPKVKGYLGLGQELGVEGEMTLTEYKESVSGKVGELSGSDLDHVGETMGVKRTPMPAAQYKKNIVQALSQYDNNQLRDFSFSLGIDAAPNEAGMSDAAYRKQLMGDLSKKINSASPENLETIGAALGVERSGESDAQYKKRLLKELDNADKQLGETKSLEESAEDLKWKGSFIADALDSDVYNILVQGKWEVADVIGGVSSLLQRAGSYRALSNLLLPEVTKNWMKTADSEALAKWSNLVAFADSAFCGVDEARRSSIPGQGYSFVRTASGSYQFVGSIQAERSATKTPLLCMPNPDQEAEEAFICSRGLLCKDQQFCYENEDSETPEEGYFYKITWGVSAPADESYTPYVDENGKAVRFNLLLQGPSGNKWVFKRLGAMGANVLALENGQNDGGMIVKFLPLDYTRACIVFDPPNSIKDYFGEEITEICADFVVNNKGLVEYEGASATAAPVAASTSAEVEMDI